MMIVGLWSEVGDFAGDKDVARGIREEKLEPAMLGGASVTLDFSGVELATQSFIHALISDLVRSPRFDALDLITFINCNPSVRELIEIVVEYSQEDVTDLSSTEAD
jgi:hypothetical protein